MAIFDSNSPGLLGKAGQWMTPERGLALAGLGQAFSQLGAGQPVDLSSAHAALQQRRERQQAQQALQSSGLMEKFSPEQRAILAQMEPSAAQKIIASVMFAPPPEPVKLQTFTGPDGTVYQFNPSTGAAEPITGAKPADPEKRAEMVGPNDPRRKAFGLPADGKTYEVEFMGDTPTGFSVPGSGGTVITNNLGETMGLTPGQKKVDEAFAEDYIDYITTGGADSANQTAQIGSVLERLEAGEELTGPTYGMTPEFMRAITNPDAADAQARVEGVVQRSLRDTLGPQFTQVEGDRLIARAYDPKQLPAKNAARLRALYVQIAHAAEAKAAMVAHWEEYGTLKGYAGPRIPSVSEFDAALDAAEQKFGATEPAPTTSPPEAATRDSAPKVRVYNPETGKLE